MKITLGETLTGRAGKAEEIVPTYEAHDDKDWNASVSQWFITAPGQSILWDKYGFS